MLNNFVSQPMCNLYFRGNLLATASILINHPPMSRKLCSHSSKLHHTNKNLNQYQLFIIESIYIISLCPFYFKGNFFSRFNTLRGTTFFVFVSIIFFPHVSKFFKFFSSFYYRESTLCF